MEKASRGYQSKREVCVCTETRPQTKALRASLLQCSHVSDICESPHRFSLLTLTKYRDRTQFAIKVYLQTVCCPGLLELFLSA